LGRLLGTNKKPAECYKELFAETVQIADPENWDSRNGTAMEVVLEIWDLWVDITKLLGMEVGDARLNLEILQAKLNEFGTKIVNVSSIFFLSLS